MLASVCPVPIHIPHMIYLLARSVWPVADPESFHWVSIQYRNSASQYVTVLATVLRYLGRWESGVVLGLPKTWLGPPLLK
jgi:hypothetical protein